MRLVGDGVVLDAWTRGFAAFVFDAEWDTVGAGHQRVVAGHLELEFSAVRGAC